MSKPSNALGLHSRPGSRVPVEQVISWLLTTFPGATVTHENSFEAERERYRNVTKKMGGASYGQPGLDLALRSSFSKEMRHGPGKDVFIPVGETHVRGSVWTSSVTLYSDLPFSHPAVQQIASYLKALDIGDVYEHDLTTSNE